MLQTRREVPVRAAALAGGVLTGWAEPPESASAQALRAACGFLARDNRPTARGALRAMARSDGDALTRSSCGRSPARVRRMRRVVARGVRWLARHAVGSRRAVGRAPLPALTAGYAAQVFANAGDTRRAGFWVNVIERLRIRKELGWQVHDVACGAWSDASAPPALPSGTLLPPDMLAPNVSATLLAVQALAAAGRASNAAEARPFIEQCQNFAAKPEDRFDDGGFFFAIGDPVRNKAGVAGRDAAGQERYRSYGSATCDGLLALHTCGVGLETLRMRAGFDWLRLRAARARPSGHWPAGRSDERESLRYYHAQAFAAVLALAAALPERKTWADEQRCALTVDLIAAQRNDGAWSGTCTDSFEDDPLVATSFGIRALHQGEAPAARNAVSWTVMSCAAFQASAFSPRMTRARSRNSPS